MKWRSAVGRAVSRPGSASPGSGIRDLDPKLNMRPVYARRTFLPLSPQPTAAPPSPPRRSAPAQAPPSLWPDRVTRPQPGPIPSAQMTNEARDIPEVRLAELVMPNHTNHHGTLFGGHALGL